MFRASINGCLMMSWDIACALLCEAVIPKTMCKVYSDVCMLLSDDCAVSRLCCPMLHGYALDVLFLC